MKRELSAIKSELSKLQDSHTDLKKTAHVLAAEVARSTVKIDDLQSLAVSTKSSVDRLVGVVESFCKDVEAAQRDRKSSSDAYMQHQRRLDNHEGRLSKLEASKRP